MTSTDRDKAMAARLTKALIDAWLRYPSTPLGVSGTPTDVFFSVKKAVEVLTPIFAKAEQDMDNALHELARLKRLEAEWNQPLPKSEWQRMAEDLHAARAALRELDPYVKDGETPFECVKRNRADVDTMLSLLAIEKTRHEQLETALLALADHSGYGAVVRGVLDAALQSVPSTERP